MAQFKLGELYAKGQGVVQDYKKAVYWYQRDANHGGISTQYILGTIYQKEKDYKKAFEWYEKAANHDYEMAQFKLGELYAKGQGVAQDYKKAVYWLEKSAKHGHKDSIKLLNEIKDKMK